MSQYPEHDKLAKVATTSQAQGEFVDWLGTKVTLPYLDLQALLAEFHGIDLQVLEQEKRDMLEAMRGRR